MGISYLMLKFHAYLYSSLSYTTFVSNKFKLMYYEPSKAH
jgi:hypothetical protein